MHTLKNITLFFLFFHLSFGLNASIDQENILIKTVVYHEARIKYIKEDVDRLWHACYEYVKVHDGMIKEKLSDNTSYYKNTYRQELRRRPSCLDSDIIAHKNRQQDLSDAILEAVYDIRRVVERGADVAAQDRSEKTALNYCYTRQIYQELLAQGVPFQWKVWAYFNPGSAVFAAAGIAGSTVIIAGCTFMIVGSTVIMADRLYNKMYR